MELDDSCGDREWLNTEPTANDLNGLWVHNLQLRSPTESVKTADLAQKIEHAHMAATSKQTLCHGFASSASGCSHGSATCEHVQAAS
eukprot:7017336-Lingulodinium_polyedra.AAC.1